MRGGVKFEVMQNIWVNISIAFHRLARPLKAFGYTAKTLELREWRGMGVKFRVFGEYYTSHEPLQYVLQGTLPVGGKLQD